MSPAHGIAVVSLLGGPCHGRNEFVPARPHDPRETLAGHSIVWRCDQTGHEICYAVIGHTVPGALLAIAVDDIPLQTKT